MNDFDATLAAHEAICKLLQFYVNAYGAERNLRIQLQAELTTLRTVLNGRSPPKPNEVVES